MIPVEHSNAVQTATAVVADESPSAITLAIDIMIAIPPSPKMEIRPYICWRVTRSLRSSEKGRMKTT